MLDFADLTSTLDKPLILVGTASCGRSAGALEILAALQKAIIASAIDCQLFEVGCMGICYAEPLVYVRKSGQLGILYANVTAKIADDIVNKYLLSNEPVLENVLDTTIFTHQVRRVSKRFGFIDPTKLEHYLATGGYAGLAKAMKLKPAAVIDEIKLAGLRGRGGGGFPTWHKWLTCHDAVSDQKYFICNADEGDPGAYMNRMLLESDPHSLLEGVIIASYAIGATQGYIYTRSEYPLAIERLHLAVKQASENNFIGDNILNSGYSFHLHIAERIGAFVCGEETALIAAIEGRRGMPHPRPPYPMQSGLWGKPTVVNNVETLANVAHIFQNSAAWFNEVGSENCRGTKIIALSGKIKQSCLVEVPLGTTTLRQVIYDIAGGMRPDKKFKAVQTGGPSGGCIPEELLDTPIDYDSLRAVGSNLSTGGIEVIDEDDCVVDFSRFFVDFAMKESCGACVPCRLGFPQINNILQIITDGKGEPHHLEILEQLSASINKTALCALGRTAPNLVLTTMKYFRDEYLAHVIAKVCSAKVCRNLMHYHILPEKCIGCDMCAKNCPVGAIPSVKKEVHVINQDKCIKCGMCFQVCPIKVRAVTKVAGVAP